MTISRRRAGQQDRMGGRDDVLCNRRRSAAKPVVTPLTGAPRYSRESAWNATIEEEVIPRLVLARRAPRRSSTAAAPDGSTPGPTDVLKFAGLCCPPMWRGARVRRCLARARHAGREHSISTFSRRQRAILGDLWCADACDFARLPWVSAACSSVLHELSPAFGGEVEHREHGRRALLVPVPGEQHTFGLADGGRVLSPRRMGRMERLARVRVSILVRLVACRVVLGRRALGRL